MTDHPIEISEEAGVRYLHFGSTWVQAAMRIRRPFALELAYTQEMMACLLLRNEPDWPRRALLIGLGAGSLAKFLYQHRPDTQITAVEINPRIPAIAQQFFHVPVDPRRLKIVVADGADYVESAHRRFDAIFVDGFDAAARPGRLNSTDFYSSCRQNLTKQGMLIANMLSRSQGHAAHAEKIRQAFDGRAILFPSLDNGNAVMFAAVGEKIDTNLEEIRLHAKQMKIATGLNLKPTISRLEQSESLPGGNLRI